MAKLEVFNSMELINVSESVGGKRAVNLPDDVAVVQALLKYSLERRRFFRNSRFPEPNGIMDGNAAGLIKKYQVYSNRIRRHVQIAADGRIDPAEGMNANGKKAMWTILMLNYEALEAWLLDGCKNENYIRDLSARFPQIKRALGDTPVGTLGLSLEPSPSLKVGALGLSLE